MLSLKIKCLYCEQCYVIDNDGNYIPSCSCSKETPLCATCPVCFGRGIVRAGFYTVVGEDCTVTNNRLSSVWTEECRSCKGTGIIWKD